MSPSVSVVVVQDLFLRAGPGEAFLPVSSVVRGTTVTPLGRNDDASWIAVRARGVVGWVRRDLVAWSVNLSTLPVVVPDALTPIPSSTFVPPTATPLGSWVSAGEEGAFVRVGPGFTYAPLGILETGEILEPVGRTSELDWVLIRYGNGFGWIARPLVRWNIELRTLPVLIRGNLTPSATYTATWTASATATWTPSMTPSATATTTLTPSLTSTWTPSATMTATATSSATPTDTASPTATATASATYTASTSPTLTPSLTASATVSDTASPTASASPTQTATATLSDVATATASATATSTMAPTATLTFTASATEMAATVVAVVPTSTLVPTATPSPTETASAAPPSTPSATPLPSSTPSSTMTASRVPTLTATERPLAAVVSPDAGTTTLVMPSPTSAPTISPTPPASATPVPTLVEADTPDGAGTLPIELLVGLAGIAAVLGYAGLFWRGLVATERYKSGFVIRRCPVCHQGDLLVETRRERVFGVPSARHIVNCTNCRSVLRESGARRWRYAVDRMDNPQLFQSLNGKILTEDELRALAAQVQPTEILQPKIPPRPPRFLDDDEQSS